VIYINKLKHLMLHEKSRSWSWKKSCLHYYRIVRLLINYSILTRHYANFRWS